METIIVHEDTTIERTFAEETRVVARSDPPESGPWNATMSFAATFVGPIDPENPVAPISASGVEVETLLKVGTWSITLTPTATPFDGRILLGDA